MSRVLPILFNTGMVRAILDGRKTATRRVIRYKYSNTEMKMRKDKYGTGLIEIQKNIEGETFGRNPDGSSWHKLLPYIEKKPPCKAGDTLYVRETWAFLPCVGCMDGSGECGRFPVTYKDRENESEGCFVYRADYPRPERINWSPSIHMPKDAARIWLKVTDVRVERINDMTLDDFLREGIMIRPTAFNDPENAYGQAKDIFKDIWDSTIRNPDLKRYGWNVNPWVWVIEFERCKEGENVLQALLESMEEGSDGQKGDAG